MDEKINKLLNLSLDMLYDNDSYLIYHEFGDSLKRQSFYVGERAIMFRLAHYMQTKMYSDSYFAEYVLDCEYNRNMRDKKRIHTVKNGAQPDIIIHKRGSNQYNLAVFEIKPYWDDNQVRDKYKIIDFLDPRGEYRFKNGALILIGKNRDEVRITDLSSHFES